jgi:hypothetical protein
MGLAEVDARWAELHREVATMHTHKEAQERRIELNIGGFRFETSVQTLRRLPHTFFDAYFSGRYTQDVCNDGSIFVDRDGELFGHVLEYMRDGHISVVGPDVKPSVKLLGYTVALSMRHTRSWAPKYPTSRFFAARLEA